MYRFMKGEFQPSDVVWPLIARGQEKAVVEAQAINTSDFFVVELSSAKVVSMDGAAIQLNYLSNEYREFFSNRDRARDYWGVTADEDQAQIDAFLRAEWSNTPGQIEESNTLRRIRRSMTTPEQLRQDIRYLMDELPEVLFITHVDARKLNGETIASRSAFIKMVKATVTELGGKVYDPTAKMNEVGQNVAIEDYSEGLAHFTEDFSRTVLDDWFRVAIDNALDRCAALKGEAGLEGIVAPHIEARLARADTTDLAARLNALSKRFPNSQSLTLLRCEVNLEVGNLEGARDALTQLIEVQPNDEKVTNRFVEVLVCLEQFDEAAKAYEILSASGTNPAVDGLVYLGEIARSAGANEAAIRFYGLALRQKPTSSTILNALAEVVANAPVQCLDLIERETLATVFMGASPINKIRIAGVTNQFTDEEVFGAIHPDMMSAEDINEIAEYLAERGGITQAADFIAEWREAQNSPIIVNTGLKQLIDRWFAQSGDTKDLRAQIFLLGATLTADPRHPGAREASRNLRRELLEAMRERFRAEDLEALDEMAEATIGFTYPMPELALYRARLLFAREDYGNAIATGRIAAAMMPDNISIWALLMRSAQRMNDILALDDFAHKVVEHADFETQRLEAEAQNRLARTPLLAFSAARDETDVVRSILLYQIAARAEKHSEKAAAKAKQLQAKLAAELRGLQIENDDAFVPLFDRSRRALGNTEKALLPAGRFFVKRKDFQQAQPIWESLVTIAPDNTDYAFQLARCEERTAELTPVAQMA
ncbi:hypothetical protein ACS0VU_00010 [Aliiroseovarius sp. KMU-71]|uniref:tetratricopeptide repeat protein n=1 Tax=Aliiroseovarius sp. KMU-71 TaxID=3453123 RepID=UPI003F446FDA